MRIHLTSILVDDQDKALRFYTEVLGFEKKTEIALGEHRWLTVVSPEQPAGTELVLGAEPRVPGIPSGRRSPLGEDLGAGCAIPCREPPAGSAHQVRASTGAAHDTKRSGGCTSCRTYDVSTTLASPSRTSTRPRSFSSG